MTLVLYGQSGDVRLELGNPSEAEYSANDISRARTRATNLVNSYMQVAYPDKIPFASGQEPEVIKTITDDLSVYYAKRSKHPGPLPMSEEVKTEYYDKSIDLLKLISTGEVEIPELEGEQGDACLAPKKDYSPTFGEGDELTWTIDSDKLDDEEDDRS